MSPAFLISTWREAIKVKHDILSLLASDRATGFIACCFRLQKTTLKERDHRYLTNKIFRRGIFAKCYTLSLIAMKEKGLVYTHYDVYGPHRPVCRRTREVPKRSILKMTDITLNYFLRNPMQFRSLSYSARH